jgi:ABC-type transport system involved in Fe-S cluster assembly fused permease/ATPase subunit
MNKPEPTKEPKFSIIYFIRYFVKYKFFVIATLILLISARMATTFEPIYIKKIIDALTIHQPFEAIISILIVYFGIKLLSITFEYLRDYIFSPVVMGVSRDIETAVFNHLLKLPVSYHADQRSGSAAQAIARGSQAISFVLDFSVSQILPPIFELIFVTILLLRLYDWQYGVITLATVVIYAWFTLWSTERRQKLRIEGNKKNDLAGGILVDSITNIDTVKYFNNEAIQFNEFKGIKQDWYRLLVRNNRIFALITGSQGIILLLGLGLILTFGIKQAAIGILSVGDIVLLSTYIVRLSIPIATLGFVYGAYKNSFADLDSMGRILMKDSEMHESEHPIKVTDPEGAVTFEHVGFGYKGRENVINDLNLEIKPGQKVAFVGSSGAGKSTIAKLIFRLYDVSDGTITIDGVNLKDISPDDRRLLLGIVPQEPAMFNDTIANNIKFGKANATKAEIIAAAKGAHIHDFIDSLPQGYDTLVGERGVKISGGEKQRVAIARAIVKNPKILLFDEATSSLDSKSEQAILQTLQEVAEGRTTIAIAHRLSTIVDSNTIYVLQHGKIVESGTHHTLLKQDGVYAGMWRLQSHAAHESQPNEKLAATAAKSV